MQTVTIEEFIRLAPQMAHRIRDEISILQTAADYLINDKSIPDEARDKITLLKGHLGGVAALARQLLIITGNESNQLKVLDVGEVISQLASMLQRLVDERNQLQIVIDQNLWPIKADLIQFEELFFSLTANARDAMSSGGRLRISATNMTKEECETKPEIKQIAADYVLIEVADTGVGIREDTIDRILSHFLPPKVPVVALGWRKSTARSRKSTDTSWSSLSLARKRFSASTCLGTTRNPLNPNKQALAIPSRRIDSGIVTECQMRRPTPIRIPANRQRCHLGLSWLRRPPLQPLNDCALVSPFSWRLPPQSVVLRLAVAYWSCRLSFWPECA